MKLSEMKTAHQVHDEDYRSSPGYRAEWDRSAFAHAVALAVLTYRLGQNMSQRDLAKATGLTQPAIARLEAGEQAPSIATLAKLTATTGLRLRLDVAGGGVAVSATGGRTRTTKRASSALSSPAGKETDTAGKAATSRRRDRASAA